MAQRRQLHVAVLGGGVAGLTAAHELVERGFRVSVWERREVPGGKARSMPVPGSARGGRLPLAGEHGFRFFPGFYSHVVDTMRRIPFAGKPDGVAGNLVPTDNTLILMTGLPALPTLPRPPRSLEDLRFFAKTVVPHITRHGWVVPPEEAAWFAERMCTVGGACEARVAQDYDAVSWFDFLGASTRSDAFQKYIADSAVQVFVAIRGKRVSAKTCGTVALALASDFVDPRRPGARVLDGPTSDAWITPWMEHLRQHGVRFHFGTRLEKLLVDRRRIAGAEITCAGERARIDADAFVLAVPVEEAARLFTPELLEIDPALAGVQRLKTAWMNGLQIYLRRRLPSERGHLVFGDTPWALTAVAQAQFWPRVDLAEHGDGTVRDIVSIDISDWTRPGLLFGKPALACTREEVFRECLAQLNDGLAGVPELVVRDEDVVGWFLDPAIVQRADGTLDNEEPLLVNNAGSWQHRPHAAGAIDNLFLASDYVRTTTDLATMEGANEAARLAVNGVLTWAGSAEKRCGLWPLRPPAIFEPLKRLDAWRFARGLPNLLEREVPGSLEVLTKPGRTGSDTLVPEVLAS